MRVKAALWRVGMVSTAAVVSTTFLLTAASLAPASAATETTPTTSNTSCSATEVIDVGRSFTYEVTCLFAANATVTVTANGKAYGTGAANSSGVFTENFVVTGDPQIAMNGGSPVSAPFGGTTTFVATGLNTEGGTNTATTLIVIPSAALAAAALSSTTPLAFTGADLAAAVIGGLVLLAMGTSMVVYARRRAARRFPVVRPGPG
jgi:hypothetical protein